MRKVIRQSGVVDIFLILVVFIAAAGVAGYVLIQQAELKKAVDAAGNGVIVSKHTAAVKDKDEIIAAVKTKASLDHPYTQVTVDKIVGDNARGTGGSDSTGFQFIAHRSDGTWNVIFQGQQEPGMTIGKQFELPADWYSMSY